jgi:hypothetical protein
MQRFMKSQNPAVANVNVENLIDSRLVRKLDDTGFINEMKKSIDYGNFLYFSQIVACRTPISPRAS